MIRIALDIGQFTVLVPNRHGVMVEHLLGRSVVFVVITNVLGVVLHMRVSEGTSRPVPARLSKLVSKLPGPLRLRDSRNRPNAGTFFVDDEAVRPAVLIVVPD